MAVGKKTGGRSKGTPNKAPARCEKEIAKGGDTPLEYMLKILRNPNADPSRRDDMAKAAAALCPPQARLHPAHRPKRRPHTDSRPTQLSGDGLVQLERIFGPLGDDDATDQGGEGAQEAERRRIARDAEPVRISPTRCGEALSLRPRSTHDSRSVPSGRQ